MKGGGGRLTEEREECPGNDIRFDGGGWGGGTGVGWGGEGEGEGVETEVRQGAQKADGVKATLHDS